ncbi:putative permease [Lunatimonas lonarensis]|uniref:Putative permease n=1 Tax=Lunatimonas lonarensis TaxID=1232681 RepID=R7ZSY4_9BACT|nr:DMT family transporter [Lunatimonas lonarensis]EON77192.1 putative permease [Lunatimonas lonarensis]
MTDASSLRKDYLTLHLVILVWSFTGILGLLISVSAVEIVFHRTWMAVLSLGLIFWVRGRSVRLLRKDVIKIILTGFLISAHWILFFWAMRVSTVSVCLAGIATCSLWTSLIEPLANRAKIKWVEVLLGLLVIIGLYVIFSFEFGYWLGLSMAVLSAFICACFMVINGKLTKKHSPYTITFYEMIGAFLFAALFMPFYSIYFTESGIAFWPQGMDWFWLVILAVICTVFAFTVSVELMKRLTAFAINLTVNLEPVYGIILALMVFGESEKMSSEFYWGTLIILLAVCIYPVINYYEKRKASKRLIRA